MLTQDMKVAIYMEDALAHPVGKMGHGVLKYLPNEVVAVIDSTQAGKDLQGFLTCLRDCPVVADVQHARELGADALIIGFAPTGGRIPDGCLSRLDQAVTLGMSIVNGLHDPLAPRYAELPASQWVWDIRQEPSLLPVAKGEARKLNNKRVLFIGSDMAVGKMTAALELFSVARQSDLKAHFVATGQIGITITGSGIPLDAIRLDYAGGAVEEAVLAAKDADLVIIEGQGSLAHPASSATLPLLRGAAPTHFVFCHRAGQKALAKMPDVEIPPLNELIQLYCDLSAMFGTYPRPECVGICLNTSQLTETEADEAIQLLHEETGLPVWDVVRHGASGLFQRIITSNEQEVAKPSA